MFLVMVGMLCMIYTFVSMVQSLYVKTSSLYNLQYRYDGNTMAYVVKVVQKPPVEARGLLDRYFNAEEALPDVIAEYQVGNMIYSKQVTDVRIRRKAYVGYAFRINYNSRDYRDAKATAGVGILHERIYANAGIAFAIGILCFVAAVAQCMV